MERDKKIFLCVKSLLNISKDLLVDYSEYSDMILHIADKIAEKEQKNQKPEDFTLHGDGEVHKIGDCGDNECEFVLEEDVDQQKIEDEISEMIKTVREEMVDDKN